MTFSELFDIGYGEKLRTIDDRSHRIGGLRLRAPAEIR